MKLHHSLFESPIFIFLLETLGAYQSYVLRIGGQVWNSPAKWSGRRPCSSTRWGCPIWNTRRVASSSSIPIPTWSVSSSRTRWLSTTPSVLARWAPETIRRPSSIINYGAIRSETSMHLEYQKFYGRVVWKKKTTRFWFAIFGFKENDY